MHRDSSGSAEFMDDIIAKAKVLIEALPYIRDFAGKTVVVKYGGAAMEKPELRASTAKDLVLMRYVGMKPVVVHGGGPAIGRMLDDLGISTKFHEGLRVTDERSIGIVEMVLAGAINKDIVMLLNKAGATAVGLSGKDGNLLHARKLDLGDGEDLGHVGVVSRVNTDLVAALCDDGFIPVIAPTATDASGGTWNVNADSAAGEIAAQIQAEKLVFLTDTPGLLRDLKDPGSLIHQVHKDEVEALRAEGVIAGGMIPKVEACLRALERGVNRTYIIDGRVSHSLLLEMFTDKGLGTMVIQ